MTETGTNTEIETLRGAIRDLENRLQQVILLANSAARRIETVKAIETVRKFGFTTLDANDRAVDVVAILANCLKDLEKAETVADLIPF